MYYYNSAGRQTKAVSFRPTVENYRFRSSDEQSDTEKSNRGMLLGGVLIVAVVLGIYMYRSKSKKNTLEMKFGHKFVY
jgi:hypothetical protein